MLRYLILHHSIISCLSEKAVEEAVRNCEQLKEREQEEDNAQITLKNWRRNVLEHRALKRNSGNLKHDNGTSPLYATLQTKIWQVKRVIGN